MTKQHIEGLQPEEVEIGEWKHRIINDVSCEHLLKNLPAL